MDKKRKLKIYREVDADIRGLAVGCGTTFYGGHYVERAEGLFEKPGFFVNEVYMTRIPEIVAVVTRSLLAYIKVGGPLGE